MLMKPNLLKPAFQMFPEKHKLIRENKCTICKESIKETDFKDMLSKQEYTISGMCQQCQNKIFGTEK